MITAPCFDERVLHHAIMNLCEPILDRWLIDDTFACRNGKGREAVHRQCHEFVAVKLGLDFKASRVLPTGVGVSFLGCRIWPTHVELNGRSKRRWRRRVRVLERAERLGLISESNLQQRLVALTAFSRAAGAKSWRFRKSVLQPSVVNDP